MSRCRQPILLLTLATALVVPARGEAARPSPTVRSVKAEASRLAKLETIESTDCSARVLDELREGRRSGGCRDVSERARRSLVTRRDAFGFVERQLVDLASLRLVLGVGFRCRQWPLRTRDRDVLRRTDLHSARCRLRRYHGEVPLVFIDADGVRSQPLPPVKTDRDGRLQLRFAALDQALRAVGHGQLDDYERIELGLDGWAGRVDLRRLLGFRADWHFTWVVQGRGVPGLFAARHPEHPGADQARDMAADAQLARQEHDLERVEADRLSPQSFIDRHPWSPFLDVVVTIAQPDRVPEKPQRDPRLPRVSGADHADDSNDP